MDVAMSGNDMEKMLPNVKVLLYGDLRHFDNIDDVLAPTGKAVILYQSARDWGHWCGLLKKGKTIYCFDSYGAVPDDELKDIKDYFRKISHQIRPHLSHLLFNSPYRIDFNDVRLQQLKEGVNTCGRHVAMRLLHDHMSNSAYANALKAKAKKLRMTPDQVAVAFTDKLLKTTRKNDAVDF